MKFALVIILLWLPSFLAHAAAAVAAQVVITELMYHPPDDRENLQYIELFNRTSTKVDLSGWSFTKGVEFRFPTSVLLPPRSYMVVARDTNAMLTYYGKELVGKLLVGNFGGKLSHHGETVSLTDQAGSVVDSVSYSNLGAWPRGPDGFLPSLERISPQADSNDPANWSASKVPATRRAAGTPGRRNDSYSLTLPPSISEVRFVEVNAPNRPVVVSATVSESATNVILLWQTFTDAGRSAEHEMPMARRAGGGQEATLPGQTSGTLTRFCIRAIDALGAMRLEPGPNEPRPTYSVLHFENTNTATIPFAFLSLREVPEPRPVRGKEDSGVKEPTRGNGTFVVAETNCGPVLLFDHVRLQSRSGGWKVHFQTDRRYRDITSLNVIFESPRWVLAEPLGHEIFRRAGVPAPQTDFVRFWENGKLRGFYLTIEQENKAFLERHQRDPDGDLFKLGYAANDIISRYEKKTNPLTDHTNLLALIQELNRRRGDAQWQVIRDHFRVEEVASYFAVTHLIANWDGFHNNEFIFHDVHGAGKWEIYPWDLDKTFGDFDNHPDDYSWYTMPLTMGMQGDRAPSGDPEWFRSGAEFSRRLLANSEFRSRFLARLGELCDTEFTPEKLGPWIDAMERRLEPEVPYRAAAEGRPAAQALREFHANTQSLRRFINNRREFLLRALKRP